MEGDCSDRRRAGASLKAERTEQANLSCSQAIPFADSTFSHVFTNFGVQLFPDPDLAVSGTFSPPRVSPLSNPLPRILARPPLRRNPRFHLLDLPGLASPRPTRRPFLRTSLPLHLDLGHPLRPLFLPRFSRLSLDPRDGKEVQDEACSREGVGGEDGHDGPALCGGGGAEGPRVAGEGAGHGRDYARVGRLGRYGDQGVRGSDGACRFLR